MIAWTVDQILQECARNTFNTKVMLRTVGGYTGKGLEYINRFLSGINYAINKVCREKVGPTFIETVTLDERGQFIVSALSMPFIRVRSIYIGVTPIRTYSVTDDVVEVPGFPQYTATVKYEYMPTELTVVDLDTPISLDPVYVDGRIICQYANYQFLSEEGTEYDSSRAQVWLGLFNDSFANIVSAGLSSRVRYSG